MHLSIRPASFGAALLCAALSTAASAAPAWKYKLTAGDKLRYTLDYRSRSELNFGGLTKASRGGGDADTQKITVTIKGDLELTWVGSSGTATTVAVAMAHPVVKMLSDGEDQSELAVGVAEGLAKTAFLRVEPSGLISGVRFDKSVADGAQLPLRAILSLVQLALPDGEQTPKTWTVKETEPNGSYTARYTQAGKDADGVRSVKKRKLAFEEESSGEGAHEITVKKTVKATGDLTFRFDVTKGRLAGVRGEETQTILLNGKSVGKAASRVRLELADLKKLPAEELSPIAQASDESAKGAPLFTLKTVENKAATEQTIAEGELKDTDAGKLFAELQDLEDGKGGDEQPLYLKFKALFQLQPAAAARGGEVLGKAKADGATVRVLSGSLGTIGNEASQRALAAAVKARPANDPALATILSAIGDLSAPLPVAEGALRDQAMVEAEGDIPSTARLALGTMASNLAKNQPERSKKIVADLVAQEAKTSSDDVRRQLLLALGNSGSAEALPTLGKAVSSKNPDFREAAAKALGQIKSADADRLLRPLAKDADEHVRKAAEGSLASRKTGE